MTQSKLILFTNPWVKSFAEKLPANAMPVFPFFQTVSRLTYKPDAFDCKLMCEPIEDIVSLPNHKKSFTELADERAAQIRKLPGTIFVMWSGGIDSTTVLTSILRTWPSEELGKLVVLCNNDSIKENPNFFKLIASKKITIKSSSANFEQYLQYGYIITGELGDQIFGSDIVGACVKEYGEAAINSPWQEVAPDIFSKLSPEHGAAAFDNYRHIVDEAPFDLVTTQDFFWWLNFTQKWQHVKFRSLCVANWKNPEVTFKNLVHFFDTVDFQVWSVHNHHTMKIKDTWASYKFTAKEYIVDYTKDDSYLSKLKVPSLQNLYMGQDLTWAIDEHWNFLSKEEALTRIRK